MHDAVEVLYPYLKATESVNDRKSKLETSASGQWSNEHSACVWTKTLAGYTPMSKSNFMLLLFLLVHFHPLRKTNMLHCSFTE